MRDQKDNHKRILKRALIGLSTICLLSGFTAGDRVQLNMSLSGRSEAKFRRQDNNIKFTLPAGTVGRVKDVKVFHNGNSGIQIVLEGQEWARMSESQKTVWVYDWKNRSNDLKFCTDSTCQKDAEGPAVATHTRTEQPQPGYARAVDPSAQAAAPSVQEPEPIVVVGRRVQDTNTLTTDTHVTNQSISCGSPRSSYQCMACNCFNEAGNQSIAGQLAVGKVVRTRMRSSAYPSTVCGVVYQRKQFSWTNPGHRRKTVPRGHSCLRVAQQNLEWDGVWATHFHATYVRPRWSRSGRGCVHASPYKIGDHLFYNCRGMGSTHERLLTGNGSRRGNT